MIAAIMFIDRAVKKTLAAFCAMLLLAMVAFTVYSVVMRYVFKDPPIWGDLLTVLSNIWLVFFALALTVRDKDHIALDMIYNWLPRKAAFLVQQFWTAVIFCLGIVMIIWGIEAVQTMESRPVWIDGKGYGWARPNINEGSGHHWDVYITDLNIAERIGLAQLNIVEYGAPSKEKTSLTRAGSGRCLLSRRSPSRPPGPARTDQTGRTVPSHRRASPPAPSTTAACRRS